MCFITELSNQYRQDIRVMAMQAMSEINDKIDDALYDAYSGRLKAVSDLERFYENQHFMSMIEPYSNIRDWFNALSDDDKYGWYDLYTRYQYGPEGDSLIAENDKLSNEVMGYLLQCDEYLKQPFCGFCDSRGHKEGECMKTRSEV